MNIVETKLPIPIEDLKKYFQDKETYFVVDLKNSELPNDKIFTYLSNLNVPCDIINPDYDLLKEYFSTKSLVDIPTLEKMAISVLLTFKGLEKVEEHNEFINNNKEILDKWESVLDSLVLYNVYTLQLEETSAHVESHPIDETDDITGINFLGLLKHEDFYYYFNGAKQENVKFYKKYFNDYMFKGNNLFTYWANENNPMFLLTDAVASGTMDKNKYYEAVEKDMEALNV
jgi:hypothetical protein